MGDFQRGGHRGGGFRGGNGGGGYRGGKGGGRGEVTMHKAVCDECHKSCEVPFRPSGDKPIYCNECFSAKRGDEGRNNDREPRRDFSDRGPKRDFSDRPAPSFSKPTSIPSNDSVSRQLSEISAKLDRLTNAIEKLSQPNVVSKPAVKKVDMPAHAGVKKAPAVKTSVKKIVAAKTKTKKVVVKKKK